LRVNSLLQVDRLSMHYSVEARTPFADSTLLETIMSGRQRNSDLFAPTKATQRAVASELLPAGLLQRPKRGFTPPVRKWIRAIWNHNSDALDASMMADFSDVRQQAAQRIMRSPLDGFGRVNQMSLRLMTLELWLRSQCRETGSS
jgi:asparagine synthase (glutamine-hydrolysing)